MLTRITRRCAYELSLGWAALRRTLSGSGAVSGIGRGAIATGKVLTEQTMAPLVASARRNTGDQRHQDPHLDAQRPDTGRSPQAQGHLNQATWPAPHLISRKADWSGGR